MVLFSSIHQNGGLFKTLWEISLHGVHEGQTPVCAEKGTWRSSEVFEMFESVCSRGYSFRETCGPSEPSSKEGMSTNGIIQ